MKVGIVGSEGAKFTEKGKSRAVDAILKILDRPDVTHVVSGHCHLGGIDIWAEEMGNSLGLTPEIYPPKALNWSGGYKPRNLQIAKASDIVYCITVDRLPPDFKGMKFSLCYHCANHGGDGKNHVKSGGCWTMYQAIGMGKEGKLIIMEND